MRKIFCSDPTNQNDALKNSALFKANGAVSIIGQPPVGAAKVAFWAYHLIDVNPLVTRCYNNTFVLERGALAHHFTTRLTCGTLINSFDQTDKIMRDYVAQLESQGMSLLNNVIRTWFMVRDVDNNYAGLVHARNKLFTEKGLTADSHYITSTGIDGSNANIKELVYLDSLAIQGIAQDQIQFLKALDYLSPTHDYGVAFERGTAVHYQDRSHIYLSGTASIDNKGNILHLGDVIKQLERTLMNIEALLAEAGATGKDMCHWIVYLRDVSDAKEVESYLRKIYGAAPMVFVHAPVCRPGWLIEIEGIAIIANNNPNLDKF